MNKSSSSSSSSSVINIVSQYQLPHTGDILHNSGVIAAQFFGHVHKAWANPEQYERLKAVDMPPY
jgi:hypothetical protein